MKILKRRMQNLISKTEKLRYFDSKNIKNRSLNECLWDEIRNVNNEHTPAIYQNNVIPGMKLHRPWPETLRKTDSFVSGTSFHSSLYRCLNSDGLSIIRPGMDEYGWKLILVAARFSENIVNKESKNIIVSKYH